MILVGHNIKKDRKNPKQIIKVGFNNSVNKSDLANNEKIDFSNRYSMQIPSIIRKYLLFKKKSDGEKHEVIRSVNIEIINKKVIKFFSFF